MAGGIDWFRWHHGTVNDPKFGLVAKRAKASRGDAIAVWALVLEYASQHAASINGLDTSGADELLGLQSGLTERIVGELRARGLLIGDKVANPRRYFPAVSMRPSGGAWAAIRAVVFRRDNYTCQYCGSRGVRLECDHVVPVADGGAHDTGNLRTACFDCNRSKASRSLCDWEATRGW
jgi:hypothetical protein